MSFTTEAIEAPAASAIASSMNELDLPVREFVGYDPKGTMSVTGSPLVRPEPKSEENLKQSDPVESGASGQEETSPEESVRVPSKLNAIARKEQEQRQRERRMAQREKEFADKLAKAEKFEQLQAKLAAKDYSGADELGMNYEEYTNYLLQKQAGEKPEEQRYRKVESELESLKKSQEEKEIRDYQLNQRLWKEEITKEIVDPDKYPEISYWKSKGKDVEDAILRHVNDSFDEDDLELSVDQAAKEIEKYLADRAEFFSESPTVKKRLPDAPKVLGAPKSSPRTITQNMTVTSQKSTSTKPFHLMSEMEQWEEARRRVAAARNQR
jgi:hypothetical protein